MVGVDEFVGVLEAGDRVWLRGSRDDWPDETVVLIVDYVPDVAVHLEVWARAYHRVVADAFRDGARIGRWVGGQ